jgi:pSer/pThr/pTyr-binding forkhead associated (FHA) protein
MARLTLQLEDRVLKEYFVGPMTTIGRLPDNTIMIDSPAVSSHHACVFRDGYFFAVEDLQSTNGTFVNGTRVSRQRLQPGDVVQVGRHVLVLDRSGDYEPGPEAEAVEETPPEPSEGETVFIDKRKLLTRLMQSETNARKYDALVARLRDVETNATRGRSASADAAAEPIQPGMLRVLAGKADRAEYTLDAHTSLIGKGPSSLIRLRGWFKPRVAVAITRNRHGYVATLLAPDAMINSVPVKARHELKDGDVLDVSGLLLEFKLARCEGQ